ncbi:MAG: cytochrome c oxidase subunit 3 [Bacteroidetes bacterium]|nr:cytochrome c oxidase subunit 3 [Bacteroidota bacterium]
MTMPAALKTREPKEQYKIAPAKFNIWLLMVASCMLFAAFVSAYIVHKPDNEAKSIWTKFELPVFFTYSAIVAAISSITIYLAWKAAKRDEIKINRLFLATSLFLGFVFCLLQYLGWKSMIDAGLPFVNAKPQDISASYVWVITAIHLVHVLGGIILLAVTLARSFAYRVHKKSMTLMSVTHTYWHFVGLLWIYLFLFLYFAR